MDGGSANNVTESRTRPRRGTKTKEILDDLSADEKATNSRQKKDNLAKTPVRKTTRSIGRKRKAVDSNEDEAIDQTVNEKAGKKLSKEQNKILKVDTSDDSSQGSSIATTFRKTKNTKIVTLREGDKRLEQNDDQLIEIEEKANFIGKVDEVENLDSNSTDTKEVTVKMARTKNVKRVQPKKGLKRTDDHSKEVESQDNESQSSTETKGVTTRKGKQAKKVEVAIPEKEPECMKQEEKRSLDTVIIDKVDGSGQDLSNPIKIGSTRKTRSAIKQEEIILKEQDKLKLTDNKEANKMDKNEEATVDDNSISLPQSTTRKTRSSMKIEESIAEVKECQSSHDSTTQITTGTTKRKTSIPKKLQMSNIATEETKTEEAKDTFGKDDIEMDISEENSKVSKENKSTLEEMDASEENCKVSKENKSTLEEMDASEENSKVSKENKSTLEEMDTTEENSKLSIETIKSTMEQMDAPEDNSQVLIESDNKSLIEAEENVEKIGNKDVESYTLDVEAESVNKDGQDSTDLNNSNLSINEVEGISMSKEASVKSLEIENSHLNEKETCEVDDISQGSSTVMEQNVTEQDTNINNSKEQNENVNDSVKGQIKVKDNEQAQDENMTRSHLLELNERNNDIDLKVNETEDGRDIKETKSESNSGNNQDFAEKELSSDTKIINQNIHFDIKDTALDAEQEQSKGFEISKENSYETPGLQHLNEDTSINLEIQVATTSRIKETDGTVICHTYIESITGNRINAIEVKGRENIQIYEIISEDIENEDQRVICQTSTSLNVDFKEDQEEVASVDANSEILSKTEIHPEIMNVEITKPIESAEIENSKLAIEKSNQDSKNTIENVSSSHIEFTEDVNSVKKDIVGSEEHSVSAEQACNKITKLNPEKGVERHNDSPPNGTIAEERFETNEDLMSTEDATANVRLESMPFESNCDKDPIVSEMCSEKAVSELKEKNTDTPAFNQGCPDKITREITFDSEETRTDTENCSDRTEEVSVTHSNLETDLSDSGTGSSTINEDNSPGNNCLVTEKNEIQTGTQKSISDISLTVDNKILDESSCKRTDDLKKSPKVVEENIEKSDALTDEMTEKVEVFSATQQANADKDIDNENTSVSSEPEDKGLIETNSDLMCPMNDSDTENSTIPETDSLENAKENTDEFHSFTEAVCTLKTVSEDIVDSNIHDSENSFDSELISEEGSDNIEGPNIEQDFEHFPSSSQEESNSSSNKKKKSSKNKKVSKSSVKKTKYENNFEVDEDSSKHTTYYEESSASNSSKKGVKRKRPDVDGSAGAEASFAFKIKRKHVEEENSSQGALSTPNSKSGKGSKKRQSTDRYSKPGPSGYKPKAKRKSKKRKVHDADTVCDLLQNTSTPIRKYLNQFVPFLLEGLLKIVYMRPDDPIQYLGEWMNDHKDAAYDRMNYRGAFSDG